MIKIKNVYKTYNLGMKNQFLALNNISLDIKDNDMLAIIGASGSGKSTLIHLIACIDYFEKGDIFIDDINIGKISEKQRSEIRNKKIGIVFQDFALIEDASVYDNIELPLLLSGKHYSSKTKRKLITESLQNVGIENLIDKPVSQLSGGQKQRVAIARAIVNEPSVILADEPTGALDSKTSSEIINLFSMLHNQGKTIVLITHDMYIANCCERIVEIKDGKIS